MGGRLQEPGKPVQIIRFVRAIALRQHDEVAALFHWLSAPVRPRRLGHCHFDGNVGLASVREISFPAGGQVRREALRPVRIVPFGLLVLIVLARWDPRNLLSENLAA